MLTPFIISVVGVYVGLTTVLCQKNNVFMRSQINSVDISEKQHYITSKSQDNYPSP